MSDSPICPVLGSDITDLSAFGGSVAELLRHGLVHDDLQAPLIEHVLEGREPTTEQFAAINKRATSRSHSFVVEPRLVLAALLALPDEAIARMAPAVGIRSRPNLKNIIDLAIGVSTNRSATQKSTVDDIVACGERWGWNISDLAASIVVGEFSPGLPAMDGYERFVIDRPSELLAAAQQATTRTSLWRSLSQVSIEALGPFTGLAIDDALGRNEWTRESAHAIATRLPATLAIPTLTTLIETGSAIQRQRAAGVLRSIASSMPNPTRELLDWVECRVEQETAGRARAELELVRAVLELRSTQTITLPDVEFTEVDLSDQEWLEVTGGDDSWASADQVRRFFNTDRSMDHLEVSKTYESIVGASTLRLFQRLARANRVLFMLRYAAYGSVHRNLPGLDESRDVEPLFISAVAVAAGIQDDLVFKLVSNLWRADPQRWTSIQLGKWLSFHAIDIVAAIEDPSTHVAVRHELFELALCIEERPGPLHDALVRSAVTGPDEDRKALWPHVDDRFTTQVLTFLSRGQAERIGAAQWLGAHPSPAGTEALTLAAQREADDRVKAAMLTSLERLGSDLDRFLSPTELVTTAHNAMSKKSSHSRAIDWLAIDTLPPIRWRDGDPVDSNVVRWFLHSAAKNKSARPSPILQRHFSDMNGADTRAFGEALLLAWIDHDLALEGRGSARTSQGLLALVAPCASPVIIDHARSYVQTYRGKRASQSKALIEMLAWMDDSSAVQTVMSMAHRYQPRALQQEAARQIAQVADHKGWTTEQLADRSVPTGGFDRTGTLTLDYGSRTFTAKLTNDLDITIVEDSTGKSLRSMPRGRADEDAAAIGHAKGILKDAITDIRSAVKHQPLRLRRAMATERVWSGTDFQQFVLDHPVMLRLASRVLWSTDVPGGEIIFRPLIDGTLLTLDDDHFVLVGNDVKILHGQRLDPETRSRALVHLRDYEVAPLISQLDPIGIVVAKGQRTIDLVAGSELSANLLASRARALGWQVADNLRSFVGVFLQFADLGLEAILAVDGGLHLGGYEYSDHRCRLGNLFVVESGSAAHGEYAAVDLSELSPVLLTEIVRDVHSICGQSSGAD